MPHDAPAAKKAATLGYGARVVDYDRYREDREEVAQRLVDEKGLSLIPPFNPPDVTAGQGTAAKELFEEVGALGPMLVCQRGDALLAGQPLTGGTSTPDRAALWRAR